MIQKIKTKILIDGTKDYIIFKRLNVFFWLHMKSTKENRGESSGRQHVKI